MRFTAGDRLRAQAWLGVALYDLGQRDEAAATLRPAVEALTGSLGAGHPHVREHAEHLAALNAERPR